MSQTLLERMIFALIRSQIRLTKIFLFSPHSSWCHNTQWILWYMPKGLLCFCCRYTISFYDRLCFTGFEARDCHSASAVIRKNMGKRNMWQTTATHEKREPICIYTHVNATEYCGLGLWWSSTFCIRTGSPNWSSSKLGQSRACDCLDSWPMFISEKSH